MNQPNNGQPPEPESVGSAMAAEMLKNLVRLNDNIERSHKIQEEVLEALRDLTGYHETWMRASEILIEKHGEGKSKFTVGEFVEALVEAADDVMGDEEDDEHGPEDPLVDLRR